MTGNIGKNIKKMLIDQDKTARELAQYAGVTETYISKLCNNDRDFGRISADKAIKMADFLGCSVYDLISPPAEDVARGNAKYGLV